jgi:hypothetical protein
MITLLENVFGNFKYSSDGWDFVWDDDATGFHRTFHYNTSMLIDAVYRQSVNYDNTGGVPCEPDSIFVICNNYPQVAFTLFDRMYGTDYSARYLTSQQMFTVTIDNAKLLCIALCRYGEILWLLVR